MNSKLKFFFYFLLGLLILYFTPVKFKANKLYNNSKNLYYTIFPIHLNKEICIPLQRQISYLLKDNINNWSITILNSRNIIVADINGDILRIPASNQKLFSTAYALDILGPHHRFTTKLFKNLDSYSFVQSFQEDL